MTAETDLFAALNVAGVNALIGQKFYPDFVPEDQDLPAIAYARSGTEPIVSISNVKFGDFVSFTVMCWAADRDTADAMADVVEAALRTAGHDVTGRAAGADEETGYVSSSVLVTLLVV